MTSMIDVLVVLVVFMLIQFTATGECGCHRPLNLPRADGVDIIDAPMVSISGGTIFVDGLQVRDEAPAGSRVHRIDELFNLLKQKHDVAKTVRPDREPPSHVILAIDSDVPASTVKSAVRTAAIAGYPQIDFMVEQRERRSN